MSTSEKLKQRFYEEYVSMSNRSRKELNFIMSQVNTMAAYVSGTKIYTSIFAILDTDFNILYSRNVKAYMMFCGISDDGKYAIFSTARTKPVTDDSEKLVFVDVEKGRLLWRVRLNVKDSLKITGYCIDTLSRTIILDCPDSPLKYDFKGNKLNG